MRTLICEGVRSFIVVESWLFLLGLEVFSMWDSTSNSSERGEQGFLIEEIYFQRACLLKSPLYLDFHFRILGLFQAMSDRDLGSWALTVSFSDGPSKRMGSSLHRPNSSYPSGPLRQARQALYFIIFSCPLHPNGPSAFRSKDQWGDDPNVWV